MTGKTRTLQVADLISSTVVTAEGENLGKVVDMHLTGAPDYEITGLLVGRMGWLERLDIARLYFAGHRRSRPRQIPWSAVDRFERPRLILKPGYDPDAASTSGPPSAAGK